MKWLTRTLYSALLLAAVLVVHASVPAEVGSAQMIRGSVTAELAEQDARKLEKSSPIFETDQIVFGKRQVDVEAGNGNIQSIDA